MKMLKYTFGLLVGAVVFLSSCRDTVDPNIPYTDFDTGAYLRTISRTSTTFNFFDLGSSNFALTLEAVDSEDGASVETVDINVQHRRLITGVGLEYTPTAGPVTVKTLSASDFGPNSDSRFLRTSFVITAAEAMAAVGLTEADIEGGDVFEFSLELHDKYGRTFNRENVSGNIAGAPFYASPFQYFVNVVCPSDLGGTYAYSQTSDYCGDATFEGSVTFTATSTTGSYTISDAAFGLWGECYGDDWAGSVRLNDACNNLTMSGTDTYGDSYTMTVTSSDSEKFTFDWINTWGEYGTVTIFANDGESFPIFQ
ncbi:hypothetical protein [Algoriphagus sp. PAP.12]|uniref:hypothetical protein n=1 Tax=Algoriphagus sp. PAP.12 TaxID=2996678 RepID=UPI00227D5203|nr:hypothetical protein [Algoriphagus sp. PAP.12]